MVQMTIRFYGPELEKTKTLNANGPSFILSSDKSSVQCEGFDVTLSMKDDAFSYDGILSNLLKNN